MTVLLGGINLRGKISEHLLVAAQIKSVREKPAGLCSLLVSASSPLLLLSFNGTRIQLLWLSNVVLKLAGLQESPGLQYQHEAAEVSVLAEWAP